MKTKLHGILTLLLAFMVQFTFAQEKTISGTVSDETGPLPGVNVLIKGTTTGTETDFDGKYSITANTGDVLVYSFIGMSTKEVTVGTSNSINVVLVADNILEEVVILGYATQRKTELTGSTVQINADEIGMTPVSTVDQVLQGKVAGLVFNSDSGTPGSTSDVRIRGVSSITAGNEPLYVIDGVPVVNNAVNATTSGSSFNPLASINSNNIESITVLKDASATAAYGARGANGVIVITTKGGKSGKTSFNFSTSYGFSNDAVEGPTPLTGAERTMLFYEGLYNTFGSSYNLANVQEAKEWYNSSGYFGTEYSDWEAAGSPEGNWKDVITNRDAPIQEYNLSASGGDEDSNYYVSLGYFNQEATVIGSTFDRTTGTFNYGKSLTSKLKFNTRNSASYSLQDGILETSAYFSSPRAVVFFMSPIDQPYTSDGEINVLNPGTGLPNPLWIAQEDIDDQKFTRIITNNSLDWETPIKGLTASTRVNIDWQVGNYKRYRNRVRGDGASSDGYGWQNFSNRSTYVFQNSLKYSFTLNDSHNFDFTALQEFQKNRFYYLEADGESFADDGLTNLNSAGTPTTANSTYSDWSVASYLAMMHYSFNSKYVFDATYRREGSSLFAADNRWGDFWSVGAAWNVFKEDFLADSNVINNLKFRGSYGVTGNSDIAINQYQAFLAYNADYAGEGAVYPSTFGNNDLSWETSYTLDVGLEYGLFQNRVRGSFAYYRRESKDLLLDVPLSLTTGFNSQTRNIGRMENKGFEVEANFEIVRTDDFNLSFGGNLATNANEVLELAVDGNGDEINITDSRSTVQVGHPVYAWYLPEWAGTDVQTGEITWYTDGAGSPVTTNFTEAEQVFVGGSAVPKLTAGANIHIDFKGFSLDANGYYQGGHSVYEDWHRYTNGTDLFATDFYNGVNALLDRWQKPGDVARFEAITYSTQPWRSSSKFLYDGDYFRLKNVTFAYDFNSSVTDVIKIDALRVFVRGTNVATWVKDDRLKYDPETDARGTLGLRTPAVKSFVVGINVKF